MFLLPILGEMKTNRNYLFSNSLFLVCKLNISYVMLNLKLLHVPKQLNVMSFETLVLSFTTLVFLLN